MDEYGSTSGFIVLSYNSSIILESKTESCMRKPYYSKRSTLILELMMFSEAAAKWEQHLNVYSIDVDSTPHESVYSRLPLLNFFCNATIQTFIDEGK